MLIWNTILHKISFPRDSDRRVKHCIVAEMIDWLIKNLYLYKAILQSTNSKKFLSHFSNG